MNNQTESGSSVNATSHQHAVKKSSEPGVINDAMLKNVLHAHGPCGEAARLSRNIAIDYGTITELYLDYQNILKIDHIWMCFSLRKLSLKSNKLTKIENLDNLKELCELDLSFNFVKRIENLDSLRKLEHLTLFQNDIQKIENLNELDHLVRLNLGNNFIETIDGVKQKCQLLVFFCFFLSRPHFLFPFDSVIFFFLFRLAFLSHFIRDFEYVFKVLRLLTGVLMMCLRRCCIWRAVFGFCFHFRLRVFVTRSNCSL